MFTSSTSSQSRIARVLDHVADALGTSTRGAGLWLVVVTLAALDAASTSLALSAGLSEANPVIEMALGVGGPWGLIATQVALVAVVTVVVRSMDSGEIIGLGVAATLGIAVVVSNVGAVVRVGLDGGVVSAIGVGVGVLVGVFCGYVVAFERSSVRAAGLQVHRRREDVFAVAFSVLMVTSMVGAVAFVGTHPIDDSEYSGTASAQSSGVNTANLVYLSSGEYQTNVEVYAVYPNNGSLAWSTTISGSSADDVTQIKKFPDEDKLIVNGGYDIHTLDATDGSTLSSYTVANSTTDTITALDINKDGSLTAIGTDNGHVKHVSTSNGNTLTNLRRGSGDGVNGIDYADGYTSVNSGDSTEIYDGNVLSFTMPSYRYISKIDPVRKQVYSFTGDNGEDFLAYDLETGTEAWTYENLTEDSGYEEGFSMLLADGGERIIYPGDTEFVSDEQRNMLEFGPAGDLLNRYSTGGSGSLKFNGPSAILSDKNTVFITEPGDDYSLRAYNMDTKTVEWTNSYGASDLTDVATGEDVSLGANSGGEGPQTQVTDQNGDPIQNATVEAYRADQDEIEAQFGDSISSAEAEADRLLDEATDPVPESFEEYDLSPGNMDAIFSDGEPTGIYPTTHTEADMGLAGYVDSPDLQPRLTYESGESIYLYAWDPSDGAAMGFTDDGVTSQHVGSVDSNATFELTKLDAFGDEIESREINATQTYSGGAWPTTFEHDYAQTTVPDGYYRVSVKGSDAPGYVIEVGNAADILETNLETEAGQLSERAENLQNRLDSGIFTRQRGFTNASGVPQDFSLPQGEVAIQAYKGPDASFFNAEDPSQITASDLRDAAEAGYDGAVYLPSGPQRLNTNDLGENESVTIELRKVDIGRFSGMEDYEQRIDDLLNQRLNESTAELEGQFRDLIGQADLGGLNESELESRFDDLEDRFGTNEELTERLDRISGELDDPSDLTEEELRGELEDMERAIKEERSEELQKVVEENDQLESRVEELVGELETPENTTDEDLQEQLSAMEQALADVEGQLAAEPPTSEVDSGQIFAEFPFAEDLNPDAITVLAHYQDGSTETISDEYWRVESASVLGGDQVVVEGLNISDDRAVADLEVKGVSTEGALGTSRDSITNPAYQGTIPEIDAIDISALRPGVGETVGMSVRSSDEGFAGAENAVVYGPEGQQLNVSQEDDRFRWTPEQTGTHTIRMTYTNDIGGEFTETVRVKVRETPRSDPPTIRVTDGIGGQFVLAADGLESGSISVDGEDAELVAQAPGGESPTTLDIRAQQLDVDRLDVSVVSGANQQSVDRHVSLRVRANFDIEDALVLRQAGQPITADEETPYGAFETRTSEQGDEHQVVETYTEADGTATVQVNRDPGLLDRASYQIAIWGIDLPFAAIVLPAAPSDAILTMSTYTPAVDEATPGEIVFGPGDMTAAPTGVMT
ncbi:hypothetical protein [Halorubrum aethiopicum]|uniref:hypothetical protein n=1 Tax=Halorubrum aethiopicum TaxID=1758255 RepID=UPI000A4851E6|nr:hypothetical protein [Halorubrum aethiopicum]